jgi:chromosome segregation ATPase
MSVAAAQSVAAVIKFQSPLLAMDSIEDDANVNDATNAADESRVEELEERVAELEEELEQSEQSLSTAAGIGQQMVRRLQQLEEENEDLRDGTATIITQADLEAVEQELEDVQTELENCRLDLGEARAQQGYLESQASGVEMQGLQAMMDDKDKRLHDRDELVQQLQARVSQLQASEREKNQATSRQEEAIMVLRRQVANATAEQQRLVKEKQLAEAMKFVSETKIGSLETKLANAEARVETLQRRESAAPKRGDRNVSKADADWRLQLSQLQGQLGEQAAEHRAAKEKATELQEENLVLRTRVRWAIDRPHDHCSMYPALLLLSAVGRSRHVHVWTAERTKQLGWAQHLLPPIDLRPRTTSHRESLSVTCWARRRSRPPRSPLHRVCRNRRTTTQRRPSSFVCALCTRRRSRRRTG